MSHIFISLFFVYLISFISFKFIFSYFLQCFYLQNQPRRCLAALEQRGLLSAHNTQLLSSTLLTMTTIQSTEHQTNKNKNKNEKNNNNNENGNKNESNTENNNENENNHENQNENFNENENENENESSITCGTNFIDLISAFQLASRCLFSLEEYEDCVTLLGPLVSLDNDSGDNTLFICCDNAVLRAKELFESNSNSINNSTNNNTNNHQNKNTNNNTNNANSNKNKNISMEINPISGIYNTIGQCYDLLDNRPRAVKALIASLSIDSACTEAGEYLVSHGLLSIQDRKFLLRDKLDFSNGREWLRGYYYFTFMGENPENNINNINDNNNNNDNNMNNNYSGISSSSISIENTSSPPDNKNQNHQNFNQINNNNQNFNKNKNERQIKTENQSHPTIGNIQCMWEPSNAEWMARQAEQLYDNMRPDEAYVLARTAYTTDPFDSRGLLVYIACLLELKLKTELFYLGHELSSTYPKMAISWYTVGCYYLCCKKYEIAQKHLQRATKIDKRFSKAWIALGLSLSQQEESEHSIAAYRAACRLLPGDHRPMVLMAKELVSTYVHKNY